MNNDLEISRHVNSAEPWLDDAYLDFATIRRHGTDIVIDGYRVGEFEHQPARFPIRLTFGDASTWVVEDPEQLDGLVLDDIVFDQQRGGLVLTGPIPGSLFVKTSHASIVVGTSEKPAEVRRWGRWVPAERH
jgi:hypothetical protein